MMSPRRLLLLVGTLALAAVPGLGAQGGPPAPPTLEQQLVGSWEGTYQSDHVPPGTMRLVIARDSTWRVTMLVQVLEQLFTSQGTEVTREGNLLRWLHETMGQSCQGSVVLEGATLTGETSCAGSGLTFTLTRRAAPGAGSR